MAAGVCIAAGPAFAGASKCSSIRWLCACLVLVAWVAPTAAYESQQRFLFISSPTTKNVYYAPLPKLTEVAKPPEDRTVQNATVLIDGEESKTNESLVEGRNLGLEKPLGLAVWHARDYAELFVADPGMKKIFKYRIEGTDNVADPLDPGTVSAGAQIIVRDNISNVYGLALDGFGNLYYTTTDGAVGMLTAVDGQVTSKSANTVLYSSDQATVAKPGGIATDSFYVYWANQEGGQTAGTLVKAIERDPAKMKAVAKDYPKLLAKNAAKAMGVCIARDNVFYTGETKFLYAVKSAGGSAAQVSGTMQSPRGCAYDGDNTVYVADAGGAAGQGAIYSLPGNYKTLRAVRRLQKVASVDSPEQVAVFTRASAYEVVKDGAAQSLPWLWSMLLTWAVVLNL